MRAFRSARSVWAGASRTAYSPKGATPSAICARWAPICCYPRTQPDVTEALGLGYPAARVVTESADASNAHPQEVRIAFDGDALLVF